MLATGFGGRCAHGKQKGIEGLAAHPVQVNDLDLFRTAVALRGRFQISFWDANLLAAAIAMGCGTVFSEDLKAGQDYGGVRVVNAFAG